MIVNYKESDNEAKNPELKTGHVYRFTGGAYKNVYFTFLVHADSDIVVYLQDDVHFGGWDDAGHIENHTYIEVTLQEVYDDK